MAFQHITASWTDAPIRAEAPRMRELWVRLRCSVPRVCAAVLLPDRVELLVPVVGQAVERELRGACSRAALPSVHIAAKKVHEHDLASVLTGVHAMPASAGVVDDPLEWPWSTARDLLGAAIDPWVTLPMLTAWRPDGPDPAPAFLAEVGTLRSAPPSDVPVVAIREVLRAAASATRRPVCAVRRPSPTRRLFVALARMHGWWMPRHLAVICGVGRRTLYKQLERIPEPWVRAGALCLGESRLRVVLPASPGSRGWEHSAESPTFSVLSGPDITKIL